MKKILVMMLALAANLSSFAQTDVDMGENFSLSGKSTNLFKAENANDASPSSKIWRLERVKTDNTSAVRFWLREPETNEVTDSAEWSNEVHVIMRISESGSKTYLVQDADSIYLKIVDLQNGISAVHMYSSPIKISAGISASSKSGWIITEQAADELKGNEAYSSYMYSEPGMGSFVFWGFEEYQFRIISDNGIFNYESGYNRYTGSYSGENVMIGLYDSDGNLIEKFNMWLDKDKSKSGNFLETRNAGAMFNPVGQKGKVKKIFNHLKGDDGYVRIVAARYDKVDFDLKIPPIKE